MRLGRHSQVSKDMEIELKLKYARICWEHGANNGLEDYSHSSDSDGEDLEAYDGFTRDLAVINVEQTSAVLMNKYTLFSIIYQIKITINK